jgi:hypothetical protein
VSEHPDTTRGDVAYWGLTHAQAARYHARISRMYADGATRYARKAERVTLYGGGIVLVLAIAAVICAVLS